MPNNSNFRIKAGTLLEYNGLDSVVEIPEGVIVISSSAFKDCMGMSELRLPESLVEIEDYAFSKCKSIRCITIPKNCEYIGDNAFEYCSKLEKVEIIGPIKELPNGAFYGCTNLHSIELPSTLITIGRNSGISRGSIFDGCANLESITIPNSCVEISDFAFRNCTGLKRIDLPSSIKHIGLSAFNGCSNLCISLPDSITEIESYTFAGCKLVVLPKSIEKVGFSALAKCREIILQSKIAYLRSALLYGDALRNNDLLHIHFEDGVGSCDLSELEWCENLKELTFADSVIPIFDSVKGSNPYNSHYFNASKIEKINASDEWVKKYKHKFPCLKGNVASRNPSSFNDMKGNKSHGGCYVATAVYGSYDCPEVWTLRRYRDNELAKTWHGRAFIHTYYAVSPTLVKWFGDTDWFKNMWKSILDRMVENLHAEGVEDTPYEDKAW